MNRLLLLMLFCMGTSLVHAQAPITVRGTVTDNADDSSLPGVAIQIKGTSEGTVTDMNGSYSISVSNPNAVLVFSFIGYQSQEIPVNNRTTINVSMGEDVEALSEVVVVGYATQERRDLTGSVAKVKAEDIENLPVVSPDALLQGRAPGVVVTNNSGAPGAGVSVRIRGIGSLNASNEPLYVVDGVPINPPQNQQLASNSSISPISDINPNDIASMEILKDAAATAIYGARAANGVVLITTKRGRKGPSKLSFNTYMGVTMAPDALPLLSGPEMKTTMLEGAQNAGLNLNTELPQFYSNPLRGDYHEYNHDTDWQELIRQNGVIRDYNLSLSGGGEKTTYAISPGYTTQTGTILGTAWERFTTSINVDHKISEKFSIGNSLRVSRSKTNRIQEGQNFDANPMHVALIKSPFLSPWRIDLDRDSETYGEELVGVYAGSDYRQRSNPLQLAEQYKSARQNTRMIGNVYINYNILPGLTFRTTVGGDFESVKEAEFAPDGMAFRRREAREQWSQDFTWINENILTFSKVFNSVHNFSALVGYSNQRSKYERVFASTREMFDNTIETLNAGPIPGGATSGVSEWGLSSVISRVSYIYNDKYSIEANLRRDGSSRFGANNRWATFPAVSAYWRISNESFMQNIGFISDLKIRGSYGLTGNQDIPVGASLASYSVGSSYNENAGVAQNNLAAPSLSWETSTQANIGLDFSMLNNRVTVILDAFSKKTTDLLVRAPIPNSTGFSQKWDNVGDIENKGVELNIIGRILNGPNLNWNVDFNISRQSNKVTSLLGGNDIISEIRSNDYLLQGIARQGQSLGTFYGWIAEGVYASDADNTTEMTNSNGYTFKGGDVIFRDINGDNVIDDEDRTAIGTMIPDFFGGITNNFSYKGFDLSVFFQYEYGKEVFNATRMALSDAGGSNNTLTSTLRRWRQQGDITDEPLARTNERNFAQNNRMSTRFIEDGSYLRLKNLMLGYNIPGAVFRNKISNVRVYVAGNNLLTFTRYLGQDPEFAQPLNPILNGIDYFSFPQSRIYTMGLNVTF